jgi:hypothetical protein
MPSAEVGPGLTASARSLPRCRTPVLVAQFVELGGIAEFWNRRIGALSGGRWNVLKRSPSDSAGFPPEGALRQGDVSIARGAAAAFAEGAVRRPRQAFEHAGNLQNGAPVDRVEAGSCGALPAHEKF